MDDLGPENGTSSEFWIQSNDFSKFSTMKGAKRYMKIM